MKLTKCILVFASVFCASCSGDNGIIVEAEGSSQIVYVQYKDGYFFEKFIKGPGATVTQDYVTCNVFPKKIAGVSPERWIFKADTLVSPSELENFSIIELYCDRTEQYFPSCYFASKAIYLGIGDEVSNSNIYDVQSELGS